jgi:CRP/FNR family cyclic AMP-dependent transcriptional regulator
VGLVRVLDLDPELANALPVERAVAARAACVAPLLTLPRGRWRPGFNASGETGMLVLRGALSRRISIEDSTSAELVGPGDVIRPWQVAEDLQQVPSEIIWQALEPVSLAVLDHEFEERARRWPELHAALIERPLRRCGSLATRLAIVRVPKLARRLYLLLWHLAERWGRVTPDGVVLPLDLSHRVLAELACAQRPSVSEALASLSRYDLVVRRDRRWLLRGLSPADVEILAALNRNR